jgi:anti-anti-sigma factor
VEYFSVTAEPSILRLRGELDAASVPVLWASMSRAAEQPRTIDLSELTFIDSSGLHALLIIRNDYEGVQVVNPQPNVRRVMDVLGITEQLIDAIHVA